MSAPLRMKCKYCGGENVQADAYAQWNVCTQEWEVVNTFDKGAFCEDCDTETRIVQEVITEEEHQKECEQ